MDKDNTYVGRKRTVFIEKTSYIQKISKDGMLNRFGLPLFFNMDFFRKNRFIVELQIDDEIISNDNIQGFSISHISDKEKTIKINTAIHIKNWITDYQKVNIIKVYLLNGMGETHREFDFDVVYRGYIFDCDYQDDSPITPHFLYKII